MSETLINKLSEVYDEISKKSEVGKKYKIEKFFYIMDSARDYYWNSDRKEDKIIINNYNNLCKRIKNPLLKKDFEYICSPVKIIF